MLWSPKHINKFSHKSHPSLSPCTIKSQLNGFHPQALLFHQKILFLPLVDCLTSIPCLFKALKALVFRIGNLGLATLDWQSWIGNPGWAILDWQSWIGNPGLAILVWPPEALLPFGPSLTLILSITVMLTSCHLLIHHRDITVGSHLAVNIPRLCSKYNFL